MAKTNKKISIPKLPPVKPAAIKLYHNSTVYPVPFRLSDRGLLLNLPPEIAKHIKLDNKAKNLYFVIINGVLQVSANKPQAEIPILTSLPKDFNPSS